MSRRKPPVTPTAHRDDFFSLAAKLRTEVEQNLHASVQSQVEALTGLLKLELLFGQPRTTPESVQLSTPPAPAWRSMASAPRDGGEILVRVGKANWIASFQEGYWWIDEAFQHCSDGRIDAWAPIPEWTGEVAG